MTVHPPPSDITLEPSDWYVANWRNLPPLVRPPAGPFDRAACLKRLRRVKVHSSGDWGWSAAQVPQSLSPDEAAFWLTALLDSDTAADPAALADQLGSSARAAPRRAGLAKRIRASRKGRIPEMVAVLAALHDAGALAQILAEVGTGEDVFLPGFRRHVRPYLTDEQREAMRGALSDAFAALRRKNKKVPVLLGGVAASVGMPRLLDELLADPRIIVSYHGEQYPFLYLGYNRERIATGVKRNDYNPATPEYVRGVIAHLEEAAVECFDKRLRYDSAGKMERLVTELARVRRPELAPALMRLQVRSRRCAAAQRWLDGNPELALAGLVPFAEDAALGPGVIDYLRGLVRGEKETLVEDYVSRLAPATAAGVRKALEATVGARGAVSEGARPRWFPPLVATAKLPRWLHPSVLPPILLAAGQALPASSVPAILTALRESTLSEPHALIPLLKKHAEPRSLDAFALAVFERWLSASAKFDERWALFALGLLGGDGACLRLEELVGRSAPQRAECGVECLRAIGSEQALASLQALSSVDRGAHNVLRSLARERNLTMEELADSAVPHLGLQSQPRIDFGPRQFEMSLSGDLKPCLIDQRRERRFDLPAMEPDDDPVKVELARAEWAVFQRRIEAIIPAQALRLERAMRGQRRWRGELFSRVLARHPLLGHLIRPLVWGVFEEDQRLRLPFHVTQGGGCVDLAGAPVVLASGALVGIVHPTMLTGEERLVWSDLLADNNLTPPFVQLARDVHVVREAERAKKRCDRAAGRLVAGKQAARFLVRQGWQGQRYFTPHVWKLYPLAGQFACIDLAPKISVDNDYSPETVEVVGCYVSRMPDGKSSFSHGAQHRLKLGEADPMVFDEMVRVACEELPGAARREEGGSKA
jgi:hypothetical protein